MKIIVYIALFGSALITGCANPLNQVTSDRYAETCAVAESNNRLDMAEQACYRALVNVDLGNLGPELKSQRLYNLGRIKRRLSKFDEAEQLFKQSLALEEKLPGTTDVKVGRRRVELATTLAAQNKWPEDAQYLERTLPIASQFKGRERSYTAEVLMQFSKQLQTTSQSTLAELFERAAASLQ